LKNLTNIGFGETNMGKMEFVEKIIGHIAWPIAAFFIVA